MLRFFKRKKKIALEDDENAYIAYIYHYNGSREKQIIENSPSNIANFIMVHDDAEKIIITDRIDRLIVSTFGYFIDMCPDKALLNEILEVLVPLQNFVKKPKKVIATYYF